LHMMRRSLALVAVAFVCEIFGFGSYSLGGRTDDDYAPFKLIGGDAKATGSSGQSAVIDEMCKKIKNNKPPLYYPVDKDGKKITATNACQKVKSRDACEMTGVFKSSGQNSVGTTCEWRKSASGGKKKCRPEEHDYAPGDTISQIPFATNNAGPCDFFTQLEPWVYKEQTCKKNCNLV